MKTERWRQISQLYDAALLLDADERAAFLRDACADDVELRREVERLLAQEVESFLETPPSGFGIADSRVDLVGRQIGTYRVLSLLGAGGMGEVYRARDRSSTAQRALIRSLSIQQPLYLRHHPIHFPDRQFERIIARHIDAGVPEKIDRIF